MGTCATESYMVHVLTLLNLASFKAKPSTHSMCAQESSLHTYCTENGYRITNVTIYLLHE
jgi:hypothetical protein